MASVRARITVAYGAAMVVAVVGIAIVFGAERYAATERDLVERVNTRASLAARIIEQQGVQAVTVDTALGVGSMLNVRVRVLLDEFRDYYMIVTDSSGRPLYWSDPVRRIYFSGHPAGNDTRLTKDQQRPYQLDYDSLYLAATRFSQSGVARRVRLTTDELVMTALLPVPALPGGVTRIAVGISTERLDAVLSETVGLLAVGAPLIILFASWLAWSLAGQILSPVDRMVYEVAAVSDGRSLHRRLVVDPEARDEFGRLAHTLNDMIARLETSFASLRRFTADASHELRTPLAVIRADVERAMTTADDAHERAVALEEALQQVSRMTGLVESLLTLARADEGRFDLVREPVPLEPLMREVAETAGILGEDAGITVTLSIVEPVTVHGDAERLRQLLLNLATNAVKYTPRGGAVTLALESRHDEAIVTVRDNGIGIAAADLPFIFDRFWRVDQARSRAHGGGVGLGLAICQWIAQAHDGRIDVTSRLGRGTTFTVVLPALRTTEPTPNSALTKS